MMDINVRTFPPDAKTAGRILTSDAAVAALEREKSVVTQAAIALPYSRACSTSRFGDDIVVALENGDIWLVSPAGRWTKVSVSPMPFITAGGAPLHPEPKPISDRDRAVHRAIGLTHYSDPMRFGAAQHVREG